MDTSVFICTSLNLCCTSKCAVRQKLAGPLASCLSTCRAVPESKVSGMIPTTSGKVEEAASVNRRLHRSCWTILQGWSRFRCDCPAMTALPPFHQRVCLFLLTSGEHCCCNPLLIIAAAVSLLNSSAAALGPLITQLLWLCNCRIEALALLAPEIAHQLRLAS